MPIFNDEHPVPPTVPTDTLPNQNPIINTASLYRNFQFQPTIIGYIDGTPWNCIFYHQWLGEDDVIINSQDTYDPTLKQYVKIHNFELRVTTGLTQAFDTETNTNTLTGVANVYPFITPIVGDVFIATVQDTIQGVFEVTKAERLSLYKESAWSIEYTMISYVLPNTVTDLDQFKIADLIYTPEAVDYASNPLHSESEYDLLVTVKKRCKELIDIFYLNYFDRRLNSFLVPYTVDINKVVYDPYLVNFWNKTIHDRWSQDYIAPIEYTIQYSKLHLPYITIFDAIFEQSIDKLPYTVKYLHLFDTQNFEALFQRHNLRLTNITDVLYPELSNGKANIDIANTTDETNSYLQNPYIFSKEFYNQTTITIAIELLITKLLKHQPITYPEIQAIDITLTSLPAIQQFYYIPLLLTLYSIAR